MMSIRSFMMRGSVIFIIALMAILLFAGYSGAKQGYSVETDVDGTSWGISRSTSTMNFSMEGTVSGSGNFSRNNRIREISGFSYGEKSSAVRGGDLFIEDNIDLAAREGPVAIKYELSSVNSVSSGNKEYGSSNVYINELWRTYFKRQNKINYYGPGVRTSERYEDNGEITSTYSDSWKLFKESAYGTHTNRTFISVDVVSGEATVDRYSNRSSVYALDLSSIGSLTRIDLMSSKPSDEYVYDVSKEHISRNVQDYGGRVETTLVVTDSSFFRLDGNFTNNGNNGNNSNHVDTSNYLSFIGNDNNGNSDGFYVTRERKVEQEVDAEGYIMMYQDVGTKNLQLRNFLHGSGTMKAESVIMSNQTKLRYHTQDENTLTYDAPVYGLESNISFIEQNQMTYGPVAVGYGAGYYAKNPVLYNSKLKERTEGESYHQGVSMNHQIEYASAFVKDMSVDLRYKDAVNFTDPPVSGFGLSRMVVDEEVKAGSVHIGELMTDPKYGWTRPLIEIDENYIGDTKIRKNMEISTIKLPEELKKDWLSCSGISECEEVEYSHTSSKECEVFDSCL